MARTITLRLDGDEIPAQAFHQRVGVFLDMLRKIDQNVSEELEPPLPASVTWVVESIQAGSPVVMTVRPKPRTDDAPIGVGERIIASAVAGLREIASPDPLDDLPPYFTFPVLEDVNALVRLGQSGFTSITVSTSEQTIPLSVEADRNLERFLRPVFEHTGSVEGELQMVSVARGRPRFSVRDRLSGRSIRCTVPREELDDVLRVFGKRVTVFGRVRTNERGDVLSIHMEAVEAFPLDDELPSVQDVAGAFDLTSGKSIGEHLKSLRDDS
ncbi:MAG TPA: hypothetical protein VII06_24900 [Chloroflexota bacterium]